MTRHFEFEGLDVTDLVVGFAATMLQADSSCYDSSVFFGIEEQEEVAEGRADGCLPSDAGIEDLDADALQAIVNFCGAFARDHADLIEEAEERFFGRESIGANLYFERAGHGVGFTDRDELKAPADEETEYEELTQIMRDTHGIDDSAWNEALTKRKALEERGLANRLSVAARGERGFGGVDTDAYEDDKAASGFFVTVSLY